MKSAFSIVFALVLLSGTTTTSFSQGVSKLGVGVGINASGIGSLTENNFISSTGIFIPMHLANYRLEPNIAFGRAVTKDDDSREQILTAIQVGTGFFGFLNAGSSTNIYFGGRVGIRFLKASASSGSFDVSDSTTDFFIGPAIGGEHFMSENFSLGAEVSLVNVFEGEEGSNGEKTSLVVTNGIFFVRVYLN